MTEGRGTLTRRVRLAVADAWRRELMGSREVVEREFEADEEHEAEAWLLEEIVEYAHRQVDEIALVAGEPREEAFGLWDPLEYVTSTEVTGSFDAPL